MEIMPRHSYRIRTLLPEECSLLAQFVGQHADGNFFVNESFALHFYPSIFIAEDEQQTWLGALVSWKSPSVYNTAVIEGVAVQAKLRGQGIGAALMQHTMDFWLAQCVLNLEAIPQPASERVMQWFTKEGFVLKCKGSVRYYFKRMIPERICMQNRKLKTRLNTANGQIGEDTIFEYFQEGDVVWGTYHGGDVLRGVLMGKMSPNRDLEITYMQMGTDGSYGEGTSHSSTEFLNDGRIVLYEDWIWTGNRKGEGNSIIEEVKE
jgi:GNAT superfamily N-acetyltransferase